MAFLKLDVYIFNANKIRLKLIWNVKLVILCDVTIEEHLAR